MATILTLERVMFMTVLGSCRFNYTFIIFIEDSQLGCFSVEFSLS